MLHPFEGIFVRAAKSPSRYARSAHVVSRAFPDHDLNAAARRLFPVVDDLLRTIAVPGYSLLTTVELDMFPGLFPELLVSYFSDLDWDIEQPYYVGGTSNITRSRPGRLTLESRPGQLERLLSCEGGFRWGADLEVGGVQVPSASIARAIQLSPFELTSAAELQTSARVAWAAHRDLNELFIWAGDEEVKRTLAGWVTSACRKSKSP